MDRDSSTTTNGPAHGAAANAASSTGKSPERTFWEKQPPRAQNRAAEPPSGDGPGGAQGFPQWARRPQDTTGVGSRGAADWAANQGVRSGTEGATVFASDVLPTAPRLTSGFDFMWARLRELPGISTWKILNDSLFLTLSFIIGLVWFIVGVTMGAIGVSLLLVWVGVPILAALFAIAIWVAQAERSRIKVFMGVDIPSPYHYMPREGRIWKRAWGFVRNRQLWRDIAYLFLLLPVGCAELLVVMLPVQFFLAPLIVLGGGTATVFFVDVHTMFGALFAVVIGVVALLPLSMLINFVALMHVELGRWLLAPSIQEQLVERVEELTESRNAVMRAMHLERRRIERDLHDGAQQRLVNLAMELGLAREKMSTDVEAARKLLEESHEDAKLVLTELRELVRGIHPAVLTDRGLDAAISAIAGRSPIPVGVDVDLPGRELEEVEGTAYFVVVESLTNIAKHSGATEANVSIRKQGNWLRIVVSDNGRGGADLMAGTGLRGLQDRIQALEGRFAIESPVGVGTSIMVEIPCN